MVHYHSRPSIHSSQILSENAKLKLTLEHYNNDTIRRYTISSKQQRRLPYFFDVALITLCCSVALKQLYFNDQLSFTLPLTFLYVILVLRVLSQLARIRGQSLLIIKNESTRGLQLSSTSLISTKYKFIPLSEVVNVLINEGISCSHIFYYLCIVRRKPNDDAFIISAPKSPSRASSPHSQFASAPKYNISDVDERLSKGHFRCDDPIAIELPFANHLTPKYDMLLIIYQGVREMIFDDNQSPPDRFVDDFSDKFPEDFG